MPHYECSGSTSTRLCEPKAALWSSSTCSSRVRTRGEQEVGVETAVITGVTRTAHLIDLEQHGVAVTVQPHRVHVLGVTRRQALDPLLSARARKVRRFTGFQGAGQRVVVHPGDHQDVAGAPLLHHGREQPGLVALDARGDIRIEHQQCSPLFAQALIAP